VGERVDLIAHRQSRAGLENHRTDRLPGTPVSKRGPVDRVGKELVKSRAVDWAAFVVALALAAAVRMDLLRGVPW
jgi:hypothetical protein